MSTPKSVPTSPGVAAPGGFTVRRIPQTAPDVISADEAWRAMTE